MSTYLRAEEPYFGLRVLSPHHIIVNHAYTDYTERFSVFRVFRGLKTVVPVNALIKTPGGADCSNRKKGLFSVFALADSM
jgi:hypothetical protein